MRTSLLLALAVALLGQRQVSAQGTFQNLGFESANVTPGSPGSYTWVVGISEALPGWQATIGGQPTGQAFYNGRFLDSSGVGVVDTTNNMPLMGQGQTAISGRYMAIIEAGAQGDTTLFQTGLVPMDAKSIIFYSYPMYPFFPHPGMSFSVGGTSISLHLIGQATNYFQWQGDISAFAGQTAELKFTVYSSWPPEPYAAYLDDIRFSSEPIPEPSSVAILVFLLTAVGIFVRRLGR